MSIKENTLALQAILEALENSSVVASNAVLYTEQTLTEEQKTQARKNIDSVSLEEAGVFYVTITGYYGNYTASKTNNEIFEAYNSGRIVCAICSYDENGISGENQILMPITIYEQKAVFASKTGEILVTFALTDNEIFVEIIKDAEAVGKNGQNTGSEIHNDLLNNRAIGEYSIAEGLSSISSGIASHSSGIGSVANGEAQSVVGKYNITDTDSLFIVGSGDGDLQRKNAFSVKKDSAIFSNEVFVNNNKKIATEEYVNTQLENKADAIHLHKAQDITEGIFSIEQGGTGASTLEEIKKNLKIYSVDVRELDIYPEVDCSNKLQAAVKNGGIFYFPAGVYTFYGINIDKDTVFILDPDAEFHSSSDSSMIRAYDCSFSMYGGKISSGTNYTNRHNTPYDDDTRTKIGTQGDAIIKLLGCHDCVIDSVTVPYSSHCTVILVYGDSTGKNGENRPLTFNYKTIVPGRSKNIRFINCKFNNFLLSAIGIRYGNDNIIVDGCTFTNALRAKGIPYCYAVYTGVTDVTLDAELYYTPINGYVVRNCYIENCEGTGIDTHSASNVIYENNKLIDCDNFITAYWDYSRVKTAESWAMENIIVRNNYCKTAKSFNYQGNAFPHYPFMLYSNGQLGMMRNIIIENNYVESNWYYVDGNEPREMIAIYYTSNVVIKNNTFKTTAETAVISNLTCCHNIEIDNNILIGTFDCAFSLRGTISSFGKINCSQANITKALLLVSDGFHSVADTSQLVVTPQIDNIFSGWQFVLNREGYLLEDLSTNKPLDGVTYGLIKGYYGKTESNRGSKITECDGNIVGTGNDVEGASCRLVPGTRVKIGENFFYVLKITRREDKKRFYYELDGEPDPTVALNTYLFIDCPYIDIYTEWKNSTRNRLEEVGPRLLDLGKAELIWENASPESAFANQSLAVDPREYRYLQVTFTPVVGSTYYISKLVRVKSEYDRVVLCHYPDEGFFVGYRLINGCTSANKVLIGNFNGVIRSGGEWAGISDNTKCIPLKIYGIK